MTSTTCAASTAQLDCNSWVIVYPSSSVRIWGRELRQCDAAMRQQCLAFCIGGGGGPHMRGEACRCIRMPDAGGHCGGQKRRPPCDAR